MKTREQDDPFEDRFYKEARRRVLRRKGFYKHLTSYLVMGAFFFLLNLFTSPGDWWFYFPMMGWGIGLAFHFLGVFGWGSSGPFDEAWEREQVSREMAKMTGRKPREFTAPPATPKDDKLDLPPLKQKQPAPNSKWQDSDFV